MTLFKPRVRALFNTVVDTKMPILLIFLLGGVLGDVVSSSPASDTLYFVLLAVYILFIKLYHLSGRFTFGFCLLLLGMTYVQFLLSGTSDGTEKTAVWFVLFFTVGIVQAWRES